MLIPRQFKSRFHDDAVRRTKKGEKVGKAYVSGTDPWTCHKCKKTNPPAKFNAGEIDAFVPCKGCGIMFVLIKA